MCEFSFAALPCTDNDGDGYGNPGSASCPNGSATDCDDSNSAVNPGATENCTNGIDDDCDGLIDANDPDCGVCTPLGQSCLEDFECCSLNCSNGKPSTRVCQ